MVLYMTDVQEVVVEEVPEYTLENYMSDVGGASGLILGRVPQTRWLPDGHGPWLMDSSERNNLIQECQWQRW